jgi:uncharacterized repeat protein (TIGR01451 family)
MAMPRVLVLVAAALPAIVPAVPASAARPSIAARAAGGPGASVVDGAAVADGAASAAGATVADGVAAGARAGTPTGRASAAMVRRGAGAVELPTGGRALSLRYTASGPLDAEQAGGGLLGCPSADGECAPGEGTRRWIDVDGDPATFNSSSATIVVPARAAVDHAVLYWGGDLASDRAARCAGVPAVAAPAPERADRVRIRLDGGDYVSLRATTVDGLRTGNGRTYQAYADVTRLLAARSASEGSTPVVVTVANVRLAQGVGCAGGWSIAVVYRHPAAAHRTVLLYDGLVAAGGPRTVKLDGFRADAPVEARLGVVAYDGGGRAIGAAAVNGTGLPGGISDPVARVTRVPDGAVAPGATSAAIALPDGGYAAGAVLFTARTEPTVRLDRAVVRVAGGPAGDVDGGDVAAGDRLRLSVEVRNVGPRTLRLATLAESVPAGLSMVAGSVRLDGRTVPDAAVGDGGAGYSITLGDVPPAASRSVVYEATVRANARSGVPIVARARLDFWVDHSPVRPSDPALLFSRSEQVEVVPNRVDLEVGMAVDAGEVPADGEARFTTTVTNAGRVAATGVVVTDRLPEELAPLLAEPSQGDFDAVARRWRVGELRPGASATLTLVVRVDDVGSYTNAAEVAEVKQHDLDSVPDDADPADDDTGVATVTGAATSRVEANLAVSQSVTTQFAPGRPGRLVVAVTNLGPGVASGLTVSESLPAGLTFVSGSGDGWSCGPTPGGAVCRDVRDGLHGRRHPGETVQLEVIISVAADAPAEGTVVTTVTSGVDDPDGSDDTVTTRVGVGTPAAAPPSLAGGAAWIGLAVMAVGAVLLGTAAVLHRRARRPTRTIPR